MKDHNTTRTRALVTGSAIAVLSLVLAGLGPVPAAADNDRTPPASGGAPAWTPAGVTPGDPSDRVDDGTGKATAFRAIERDLKMNAAQVQQMQVNAAQSGKADVQLRRALGTAFGGSWLAPQTGRLTVAVTTAEAAAIAQAAGATVVMVTRSERMLEAVQKDLDTLSRVNPAALSPAHSWGIDAQRNQVVLTVAAGRADDVRPLVAKYGQAVIIEESANRPQPTNYPWLDGGIPYINTTAGTSCSTGFNMRNTTTGAEYVLTAGHCGNAGDVVTGSAAVGGGGVNIGSFVSSWFPTWDDALVQVTNAAWAQGPWVWVYPGYLTISGYTDAGVGTVICQTGQTTNLTCGAITAKNVTVNYTSGAVYGMTKNNVCVEPGDSGGPYFNLGVGTPAAEGVTSGAVLVAGNCLAVPVSYYFPIVDSLPYYGGAYGATLW